MACKWCGSTELVRIATRIDGIAVLKCGKCGLATAEPKADDTDTYERDYFRKEKETGLVPSGYANYEGIPDSEFAWRLHLLDLFAQKGRLLDVGCATGKFMELARDAGWEVEGVDVSQYAAEVGRGKGLRIASGTLETVDLPPSTYDVITAFDVLEHVEGVRSFLERCKTLLKAGGVLLVLSPDAGSYRTRMMKDKWIGFTTSLEHVHYFDMAFLRRALEETYGDPHLTIACFERGNYDYLLGVARKLTKAVENPVTPTERLKVLFVNRPDSFTRPGGDVIQMLATKRALEDLDVQIDISLSENPSGKGYDLAHIFNSQIPHQEFWQLQRLRADNTPVVLSPIYWDQTETLWADLAVKAVFQGSQDQETINQRLKHLKERALEVNGVTASKPPAFYTALKKVQRSLMREASMLLPNSMLEAREIGLQLGVLNKQYTVVPNGVNSDLFLNASPDWFVETTGLKDFIIISGRVEGRKNQALVLEALKDMATSVVCIGTSTDQAYRDLCTKIRPNTFFFDHLPQEQLGSAYKAAKVCVLASWMESCGLAALEAALADCNVVVTNRGATWEYFGQCAYYCDPGDVDSIRQAVTSAYKNYERDAAKRAELRSKILEEFTWERAAQLTRAAYEQCLSESSKVSAYTASAHKYAVSIIIPVYNKVEYTARCIESIVANTPDSIAYEVIIVDNASTDGTAEFLANLEGDVKIVHNDVNLGFAKACNQGAQVAEGKYFLFLNNDTEPQSNWLPPLLETAAEPGVGIVGAKLLFPEGTVQHAGVAIARQGVDGIAAYHVYYRTDPKLPAVNKKRRLAAVTGACLLVSKDLFKGMGGFNEAYYNGCEDIDFCLRARALGYEVVYEPRSVLIHHESISGPERFRETDRNMILFNQYWAKRVEPDDQDLYLEDGFLARFVTHDGKTSRVVEPIPRTTVFLVSCSRGAQDHEVGVLQNKWNVDIVPIKPDKKKGMKAVADQMNEYLAAIARASWPQYLVVMDSLNFLADGQMRSLLKGLEAYPNVAACYSRNATEGCVAIKSDIVRKFGADTLLYGTDGFSQVLARVRQAGYATVAV